MKSYKEIKIGEKVIDTDFLCQGVLIGFVLGLPVIVWDNGNSNINFYPNYLQSLPNVLKEIL